MDRATLERALHGWDEWHHSIEQSRRLLGYDLQWPRDTCSQWIESHYPAVRKRADRELRRLELPPTLRRYWEDCFCVNYRAEDGQTDYRKVVRFPSGGKSLPDLPADQSIVWYEDEDIHDPWLRVEIRLHARFATKTLFDDTARHAYETVRSHLRSEGIKPHSISERLKGGRPPMDDDLAVECARLKDDEEWRYKDIGFRFGWPLQMNDYGNLSQCSTARRYVKRGRELRKEYRP